MGRGPDAGLPSSRASPTGSSAFGSDARRARAQEREDFFVVEIDRFQGPLDLLLHLIRTQDIEIFDIPIAKITDQFLQAIKGARRHATSTGPGEFLEMAATLIRIKAQMLLPTARASDEDEDPRAELVRRLLEYEQVREVSQRLRAAEADRGRRHGKGLRTPAPRSGPSSRGPAGDDLGRGLRGGAEGRDARCPEEREHRVTQRPVTMEEKAVLILDALKREHTRRVQPAGLGLPASVRTA